MVVNRVTPWSLQCGLAQCPNSWRKTLRWVLFLIVISALAAFNDITGELVLTAITKEVPCLKGFLEVPRKALCFSDDPGTLELHRLLRV